jgi:hypothetical protein
MLIDEFNSTEVQLNPKLICRIGFSVPGYTYQFIKLTREPLAKHMDGNLLPHFGPFL